jgi:hypothetical protein
VQSERAPAVGQLLVGPRGTYQVEAEHGRGGFGVTYRGLRVAADGAPVIIKFLPLHARGSAAGTPGERWKAVELFEREAAALRALAHPGIPRWIDDLPLADDSTGLSGFALVMELVPGPTLREAMRAGGLSADQSLAWLGDILAVLDHIHRRAPPLVHRDVNPKNIVLRPGGPAALVDFGSVQAALRSAEGIATTSAGTFGYAPMEQFLGQASPRSDLYGLGMTFVAAASGREPEALPLRGIKVDVPAVLGGAFEPRLVRLIDGLVEPDPRARVGSAAEALSLLRAVTAVEAARVVVPAANRPRPALTPQPERPWLERLERRLMRDGFVVSRGGEVGHTRLVFHAHLAGDWLGGDEVHIHAADEAAVEGADEDGSLSPIAAALFVQAVAAVHPPAGGWRRMLGRPPIVVPLIAGPLAQGRRIEAQVVESLREPDGIVVVPALAATGANTRVDVITPRSLLGDDPRGVILRVRRALTP